MTSGGFLIIQADSFPAGKPFHLKKRFENKPTQVLKKHLTLAEYRRQALLSARQERLKRRNAKIAFAVEETKKLKTHQVDEKRSRMVSSHELAEKNRASILGRQILHCSKIVQRAKKVAIEQHIKVQERSHKRRLVLEEKLRQSAARRKNIIDARVRAIEEFYRARSPEQKKLQFVASRRIQRCYRRSMWKKVIQEFKKNDLSLKSCQEIPFPELVAKIQKKPTLLSASKLLAVLLRSSLTKMKYRNPARVLLSAYVIFPNAEEMLEGSGPTELALKEIIQETIMTLDDFLQHSNSAEAYNKLQRFLDRWRTYYSLFQAWKSKDNGSLMNDLVNHYLDLERLWLKVKNSPSAELEWKPYIREYQTQVRTKIHNIGGDDAVAKLDEQLANVLATSNNGESESSGSDEQGDESNDNLEVSAPVDSVGNHNKMVVDVSEKTLNPGPEEIPKNSNLVSPIKELPKGAQPFHGDATASLTNMQIAHEMVLEPDFKMEVPEVTETEKQIQAIGQKAFLDHIGEEISKKKYDTWFPSLVKELKEGLLQMISSKSALSKQICEVLDMDYIEQQCRNGSVDVMGYAQFIISRMKEMCAPVRDEAIRNLMEEKDIGVLLTEMHRIMKLMHLDLANFKLATLKPHLVKEAVAYEQSKFDELLSQGVFDLSKTTQWLNASVDALQGKPSHKYSFSETPGFKYEEIYNEALLSMLMSSVAVSPESCPETFYLDGKRLFSMQNEIQRVTLVAVLVLVTKNTLGARHRDSLDFKTLKEQLYIILDPQSETGLSLSHVQDLVLNFLKQRTEKDSISSEALERLSGLVEKCISCTFPLYSLVSRRVSACIKQQLTTGTFKKDQFTNQGLDVVEAELERISTKVCLLAKHNKEVHAKHYDNIIRERFSL